MSQQPQFTYVNDNGTYDIGLLEPEAQEAFKLLVASKTKVDEAAMNLNLYQASAVALTQKLEEALTDEALVSEEDAESTDEE
jgi:hypothetical protein